jgi:biopolymer transport protein ExbB
MDAVNMIVTFFRSGGPFMYVILAAAVLILAIILERLWVIGRASALDGSRFTRDLLRLVHKHDTQKALALSKQNRGPAGRVAHAILTTETASEEKLNNAADGAALVVLPPLSRRLPTLSMLANVATLLGLLGTIFGLTTAFAAVGAADPSQRSAFLAAGISQALNTTAFGLMVAVPALVMHSLLAGKVESVVEQVDEISVRLVRAMTGQSESF